MHLKKLELRNYRCFDALSITFQSQLTVIVAENGVGKTTVLDAIRIALWPFIKSFDLARTSLFNEPSNGIAVSDARLEKNPELGMARQLPTVVKATALFNSTLGQLEPLTWQRTRESEALRTKTHDDEQARKLNKWAKTLQASVRLVNEAPLSLPMFGYYGTGRLWAHKKVTKLLKTELRETTDFLIRTSAYRDCMDPSSTYKQFREWFIWAWHSYANMGVRSHVPEADKLRALSRIRAVQQVIDTFLRDTTGWHTLEYSEDERALVLNHEEHGCISADLLSDGIRSMLALAGDIAYRCIKLNPHLGERAALDTEGVVLIDEVDMHLHPRWQQRVLMQLQGAFPKLQFVVTTHSPQVLTTVPPESIRALQWAEDDEEPRNSPASESRIRVIDDYQFSQGAEAQVMLENVLGVASRPLDVPIVQTLQAYLKLLQDDKWDTPEALEMRVALDAWGHGHETALLKADMNIRSRQYRRTHGAR